MSRISAGHNLTIDIDSDRWRLVTNGDGVDRVLVEAANGQPLRYVPTFGTRRRLPDTGLLPLTYIQSVVLGWSVKDEAWHLGLLLDSELSEVRGSRWCEMAHWPDPERDLYLEIAKEAGATLAKTIRRPFDLIPPRENAVAAPPPPLPSLPVTLDQWKLEQISPTRLEFTLSGAWARSRALRVLWYLFWTVVFVVLSYTTLFGRIALPKPEFLPYLGFASAGVLVILILNHIYQLLTKVNHIVIDGDTGTITGLHGSGERWRYSREEIDSIYASQIVSVKRKRDKPGKRTIHYGELNLRLKDDKFRFLLENGQVEEKQVIFAEDESVEGDVVPLTAENVESNLQAAAAHIAKVLGIPARYDSRLK